MFIEKVRGWADDSNVWSELSYIHKPPQVLPRGFLIDPGGTDMDILGSGTFTPTPEYWAVEPLHLLQDIGQCNIYTYSRILSSGTFTPTP
jgi:hypothetical protein